MEKCLLRGDGFSVECEPRGVRGITVTLFVNEQPARSGFLYGDEPGGTFA